MRKIQAMVVSVALLAGSTVGATAQSEPSADPTAEPAPGSTTPAVESTAMGAPPESDGLQWTDISELLGSEIEATATERSLGEWGALLDATGATFEQATQLNARAVDSETDETIGIYSAIRIAGAQEDQLRDAMLGVLREGPDSEEFLFEEAQIGGKDVTVVIRDTDERAIVYVNGDTAYLLDLPDERLAEVLGRLP